jgi:hypothetical protein
MFYSSARRVEIDTHTEALTKFPGIPVILLPQFDAMIHIVKKSEKGARIVKNWRNRNAKRKLRGSSR